jgi:hypothetical protein
MVYVGVQRVAHETTPEPFHKATCPAKHNKRRSHMTLTRVAQTVHECRIPLGLPACSAGADSASYIGTQPLPLNLNRPLREYCSVIFSDI